MIIFCHAPFCSAPSDTVHPMTKVARKALRWRQDMSRKWANWPKIFRWKIWKRLRWDAGAVGVAVQNVLELEGYLKGS